MSSTPILQRLTLVAALVLAGCSSKKTPEAPVRQPEDVKAQIQRLLPSHVSNKAAWSDDIYTTFRTQQIDPSASNLCAVIAVADQESNFSAEAAVPGLPKIAWGEINRRAAQVHVPAFLVRTALQIKSPTGESYAARLDKVRSEKELSAIFDDLIDMVPMGQTLFGNLNPIHTGGPMQVSIAFAEAHAKGYPWPIDGTIRREVFTRHGGIYFGTMHLLGYPADYSQLQCGLVCQPQCGLPGVGVARHRHETGAGWRSDSLWIGCGGRHRTGGAHAVEADRYEQQRHSPRSGERRESVVQRQRTLETGLYPGG